MLYFYVSAVVTVVLILGLMAEIIYRIYTENRKKLLNELWWKGSILGEPDSPVRKEVLYKDCGLETDKFNSALKYLSQKGIIYLNGKYIQFTKYGLLYYVSKVKSKYIMR
jgi:hypothetical protein